MPAPVSTADCSLQHNHQKWKPNHDCGFLNTDQCFRGIDSFGWYNNLCAISHKSQPNSLITLTFRSHHETFIRPMFEISGRVTRLLGPCVPNTQQCHKQNVSHFISFYFFCILYFVWVFILAFDLYVPHYVVLTYLKWSVRSFVRFIRGGSWLLAVFRRAFSYRQRWGLDMAPCAIPL